MPCENRSKPTEHSIHTKKPKRPLDQTKKNTGKDQPLLDNTENTPKPIKMWNTTTMNTTLLTAVENVATTNQATKGPKDPTDKRKLRHTLTIRAINASEQTNLQSFQIKKSQNLLTLDTHGKIEKRRHTILAKDQRKPKDCRRIRRLNPPRPPPRAIDPTRG